MQQELSDHCRTIARQLSVLTGVNLSVIDTQERRFTELPSFCEGCGERRCNRLFTHLYGASESYRWNGKYTYYCPLGLIFTASSVCDDVGLLCGALIAGPMIMGELSDTLLELEDPDEQEKVAALPVFSAQKVRAISEVTACICASFSRIPAASSTPILYEQDRILQAVYDAGSKIPEENGHFFYPIEYEKQLCSMIKSKDKPGARALLNEILGYAFVSSNFELSAVKARVVELIVILSRATIDAGADIREIFLFNNNYLREVERFTSIEDLSVWLTGIMHRFISYTFDFTEVKHTDVVYKAMDYIKQNYCEKISLDDVAKSVYLSRSYLSSLFKEETGQSLFSYINHVRIEKSRILLLDPSVKLVDIAGMCGFEDQSYFSKVFKKATGVSPKKYRDSRGMQSK